MSMWNKTKYDITLQPIVPKRPISPFVKARILGRAL
jgi:hypothetical protein